MFPNPSLAQIPRRWSVPRLLALGALLVVGLALSASWGAGMPAAGAAKGDRRPMAFAPNPTQREEGSGALQSPATLRPWRDDGPGAVPGWPWARALGGVLAGAAVAGMLLLWQRRPARVPATPETAGLQAWLGRLWPARERRPLEVIQSARLAGRATVHVVAWRGEEWLLGCTEQGISVLGRGEAPGAGRPPEVTTHGPEHERPRGERGPGAGTEEHS